MNKFTKKFLMLIIVVVVVGVGVILFIDHSGEPSRKMDGSNYPNQQNTEEQTLECTTWKDLEYKGKSELLKFSDSISKNGLEMYTNEHVSFYHPVGWKTQMIDSKTYRLRTKKDDVVEISIDDIKDFENFYNHCLERCFYDVMWDQVGCSESFSKIDLDKFLNGGYLYYIETGGLPSGGYGIFRYHEAMNGNIITASYGSEVLINLPLYQQLNQKNKNEFTDEEWELISREREEFSIEVRRVLETVELK